MGGNAVKGVRRWEVDEFNKKVSEIVQKARMAGLELYPIRSYNSKTTFGDADFLVKSSNIPENYVEILDLMFKPSDRKINDGTISLAIDELQCDLIEAPDIEFEFSSHYYAWNDLGNLIGRVARKVGLKFGHDGLWKMVRDVSGKTNCCTEVLVTRDIGLALYILGYDAKVFLSEKGFDTPNDIYSYAASSKYFDPNSFRLENRNYKSRVRDRKRKMYSGFLEWMEARVFDEPLKIDHDVFSHSLMDYVPGYGKRISDAVNKLAEVNIIRVRTNLKGLIKKGLLKEEKARFLHEDLKSQRSKILAFATDQEAQDYVKYLARMYN